MKRLALLASVSPIKAYADEIQYFRVGDWVKGTEWNGDRYIYRITASNWNGSAYNVKRVP